MKQIALFVVVCLVATALAKDRPPSQVEIKAQVSVVRNTAIRTFVGAGYTMSESENQLTFSKKVNQSGWLTALAVADAPSQGSRDCLYSTIVYLDTVTVTLAEIEGHTLLVNTSPTRFKRSHNLDGDKVCNTELRAPQKSVAEIESLLNAVRAGAEKEQTKQQENAPPGIQEGKPVVPSPDPASVK